MTSYTIERTQRVLHLFKLFFVLFFFLTIIDMLYICQINKNLFAIFRIYNLFCSEWDIESRNQKYWLGTKCYTYKWKKQWMLRYIMSHIYHLSVSETRSFSFMTSVDDENLSYAYMGPMPYEFIEIKRYWKI